jgi:tetratricopeptide (TPR) repeat protein
MEASVRSKPDFELGYAALGFLFEDIRDLRSAIEQYKKALALNPGDVATRGVTFGDEGDFVSAIREYREVKRVDPSNLNARQNLGAALIHTDPAAAITEFRELGVLAPDWPVCHDCLGSALYQTGRYEEAEKEYRVAADLDPANPSPHVGLGLVHEVQETIRRSTTGISQGPAARCHIC